MVFKGPSFFAVILAFFLTSGEVAATSNSLTYQGRILKSNGTPLDYSAVSFIFQITDPSGLCVVFQEQVSGINLSNSGGVFDVPIGTGTISWPTSGSFNVLESFNNFTSFTCGSCSGYTCTAGTSTYTPVSADGRRLRVQFYDGIGWKTISPDTVIRAVPYSAYALSAQKLGVFNATDFVVKGEINNSGSGSASCDSGSFLTWDASTQKFGCAAVSGASGGTVTNVTATAPLSVTNGSSTPHITIGVASSSQPGYLTAADWTNFNNKLGASSTFSGDVTGTASTTSVDRLKGTALLVSSLSSGEFLKFNGANWVNAVVGLSDINGLSTALAGKVNETQFPANCGPGNTLTRLSPAVNFTCTPISVSDSQITSIAGSKVSGNISGLSSGFTGTLGGDVSGTQGATSVDKIKGVPVSATTPTNNQVLQFNGTNWTPTTLPPSSGGTITALSGDVTASGSGSVTATVNSVGGSTAANVHSATLLANAATNVNTASTIVRRDASGNFSAGTISANLTGNVTGNLTGNVTGAASSNVLKSGDTMSGNLTHAAGTGNVYTAGSGANTVSIQGPSSAVGTSYVLRLPTSQSTGTQALVNDGSGNLSWQSLSSGSVTNVTATSPLVSSGGATPALSLAGLTGLGSANQILGMNSGATGYEYKSINGTTNQVSVSNAAGSITLSTPQNIHTGASPTFTGLTLSGLNTAGLVKNSAAGVLSGGHQVSLSSDISGILPIANGGTGVSSFANSAALVTNASGNLVSAGAGPVGSVLSSTATGPAWSDIRLPASTTANQLLYSSSSNVVSGLATANNAVLTTNGSGVPSWQSLSGDIYNQYVLSAGRSGGQTVYGGTAASNTLTLDSTSHTTKGNILINPAGGNVAIGATTADSRLTVQGVIESKSGGIKFPDGSTLTSANGIGTPGSAVAWVSFNSSGTILSSFNISSVTKASTGKFTVHFANTLSDSNYVVTTGGVNTASGDGSWASVDNTSGNGKTTSSVKIITYNNTGALQDYPETYVTIFQGNGTAPLTNGQWSQSGGNVYRASGNVGIGTSNPTTALEVNGTVKATNFAGTLNGLKLAAGQFSFATQSCNSHSTPCIINISSGSFTSPPNCTITMRNSDATSYTEKMVIQNITTTQLRIWKGNFADTGTTMIGDWICVGQ